jgi:multidrug efflux pump subunit AcrA (membrane-fusion protein)
MEVTKDESGVCSFRCFDAAGLKDHMLPEDEEVEEPTMPDLGSGFTAAEIAQMRAAKEKEIKDLRFQVKMAEADYAIKQTELESGNVIAQIDGTVVSMLSEEEAKLTMQPMLKISGGGGFYMEGTVSELEKDNLQIGQEVTVNDWNTGMQYTGTVQSVGDFPAADGYWNGMGNPNVSYYPFTVFIDAEADLQEGSYVSVMFSTATTEQGIYLENPFLRTEQGKTYVYVRGADGKLEQRFITTGKSLWGSYTEVLEGLSAEDYIAFPYGKQVKAGADTVESDLSELYG